MRRRLTALLALVTILQGPAAPAATTVTNGDAYATIDGDSAVIGNPLVERRFWTDLVRRSETENRRTGEVWVSDALLVLDAGLLGRVAAHVTAPVETAVATTARGVELRQTFEITPALRIEHISRVIAGTAAVRSQVVIRSLIPLALTGYELEALRSPVQRSAKAIAFNAGADWRDDYDYRDDTTGDVIDANAEWMETTDGALGLLLERRNYHSSRMRWLRRAAETGVDFSKDLVYLGPFEEDRYKNGIPYPSAPLVRTRKVHPGKPLALEPVIVALGTDPDDLVWQAQKMLAADTQEYAHTVNFNTDRTHTPGIDVGVRDGVNFAVFQDLLPVARDLGVETFVLDDGWQKFNGDWRTADPDRYPDGSLAPVEELLDANGMRLGLWMAPGAFHPFSQTFAEHPLWGCVPTGDAVAAYNAADPYSGSNAAGIGLWNTNAIDATGSFAARLREDIDNLVSSFGVAQFKFDFLVWVDCLNALPADMYEYRDAFFEVIDSLAAEHPNVGFGLDDTNDFRGFPYESILRGPMWFQNGNPPADAVLHNAWLLAPYVPGHAIGQAVTLSPSLTQADVDERMAAAMTYAMTFWSDLRQLAGATAVTGRAKLWTDFFKANRSLNGFSYPLLNDPLGRGKWSGMQPWNRDADSGYALLYRLDAPNATQTVAFRGMLDASTYTVTDVTPTGTATLLGTFSGAELKAGIPVTIGTAKGVKVLRITGSA